jgi:hypothetical protein
MTCLFIWHFIDSLKLSLELQDLNSSDTKKEGDWINTRKIQQDSPQDRVPWFFSHIDKTADTTHALNNPHSYSTAEH